jgi:hypothetical protein
MIIVVILPVVPIVAVLVLEEFPVECLAVPLLLINHSLL